MVLVKDGVQVEDVQYGDDIVEVISITISTSGGERRRIIVAHVPPKTGTWRREQYTEMRKQVIKCLENMITK